MSELKKQNLASNLFDKSADKVAPELLGKIIHCANGDYLITVTEAYPANDSYSYIYRATHNEDGTKKSEKEIKKGAKAYKILTDKSRVGEFFLYGGMLHLACKANKTESENARIELDNVLIRGAIKIEDNTLIIDDNINMNFGEGRPTTLVDTLKIKNENLPTLRDINIPLTFVTGEGKRIGLKYNDNANDKYNDAEAEYRFFINEIKI